MVCRWWERRVATYRDPYSESVSVHRSNASSPSKNNIWIPMSIATVPPSPSSLISLYMRETCSSTTFATHIKTATGTALSVAPTNPCGAYLLS